MNGQRYCNSVGQHFAIHIVAYTDIALDMTNTQGLDVSGRNLYSPTRYIPTTGAFLNAFHTSPGTLTLRILFAEASRPDRRSNLQKLLWLKGQALGLVNEALRDSNRQLSAGTLSDVVTMHNYEQVFGERDVAKMHRKGLKHLIDMMGGIENLRGDAAMLVPMILWSDRSRQARRLYDPTEDPPDYPTDFEAGLQPLHPLNIALLPPDQMTTSSGRSHALGISILGPGVRLMVALEALKRLASGATACRIYDNAPMTATIREKLHQAEQGLLAMQHDPDDKKEAIFFTNPKYALQQLMFDTVRLCGLVIVQLINAHLLERTHAARSKLDHALMRVGLVDISPLLEYYPRILLWIVFVQAPFLEESTRQSYSQLAGKACAKIGLESWEKVQQVLQSMYYYPEMQEAACERFWRTSTKEESPGVKQENTPPPEGPQPNESWHRFSREST